MSFLYYNCTPSSEVREVCLKFKCEKQLTFLGAEVTLFYDANIWKESPVVHKDDATLIVAGWFVLRGKLNDIEVLLEIINSTSIENAQKQIEAGIFTAIYKGPKAFEVSVFQDPVSLLPHFWSLREGNTLAISPECGTMLAHEDRAMASILRKQGHMFGEYTVDKNVRKILPFEVLCSGNSGFILKKNKKAFKDYVFAEEVSGYNHLPSADILNEIGCTTACSLSAGFDSRLIFSHYNPDFVYTWGPKHSQDVLVAQKICDSYNKSHIVFDFNKATVTKSLEDLCSYIFHGSVDSPNPQFLANYLYAREKSQGAAFVFDGYLGDVLQRGTYVSFKGFFGEIYKLFPKLYDIIKISDYSILKNRYKKLNDREFEVVFKDYKEKTSLIAEFSDYTKVTFYEFFYGRGARYISTGGIVMNSLCFNVCVPFSSRSSLNYFFARPFTEAVEYRTFKEVWKRAPNNIVKELKSEGGYSARSPRLLIPFMNFFGRLNTNCNPTKKNYSRGN